MRYRVKVMTVARVLVKKAIDIEDAENEKDAKEQAISEARQLNRVEDWEIDSLIEIENSDEIDVDECELIDEEEDE